MSMVACAECGAKISSTAKTCPQCGAKNKNRDWGAGKKIVAGFFILCIGISVYDAAMRDSNPKAAADQGESMDDTLRYAGLKEACKQAVLTKLKAPATAEFAGGIVLRGHKTDPTRYFVDGAVDAQNSFGAKLRQKYQCEVQAGATWSENSVIYAMIIG